MFRRGLLTALLLALITLLAIGPASARTVSSSTTASLPTTPATPTSTPAPASTPAEPVAAPVTEPVAPAPTPAPASTPAPEAEPAPAALPTEASDAPVDVDSDDPGTGDLVARVDAALDAVVPGAWRAAIPVQVSIISGSTSWSFPGGSMQIGRYHATGSWSHLLTVVAHEFGHQIAFADGTQAYLGAPPSGWPYAGSQPAEAWADCVSLAFTGISDPSHGLGDCPAATLAWTATWLATNS